MRETRFESQDQVEVTAVEPAHNWLADLMSCYDVMPWQVTEEECAESVALLGEAADALMRYYNH